MRDTQKWPWHTPGVFRPLLSAALLILTACAGSQADSLRAVPASPDLTSPVVVDLRALVIGGHPAAVAQAGEDLRRLGFTLVQRDRLQHILDERDPHANNPLGAQAYLIRLALQAGADVIVLVDVDGPKNAPSVIVKGIDVETGEILWSSGSVSTRGAMDVDYSRVVIDLTHRAVIDGFTKTQGGSTAVLFSHP